jgi:hypothetical protein
MAKRQPIKALTLTPDAIAAESKRQAAAKRASRKALRESTRSDVAPKSHSAPVAPVGPRDHGEDNLAAARAEAAATGMTFEEACESMGISPETGNVPEVKTGYTGPMLILREKAKNYVRGIHCGDDLASILDGLTREQVITTLIRAMKLEGNPYLALNPGQQSMNLRNKARGQLKNGFIKTSDIAAIANQVKGEAK